LLSLLFDCEGGGGMSLPTTRRYKS
jgi:hypothetical protein